jgi:hypothetical protein
LDDERSLGIQITSKETYDLLQVIDVVSTDGVLAIGMFE